MGQIRACYLYLNQRRLRKSALLKDYEIVDYVFICCQSFLVLLCWCRRRGLRAVGVWQAIQIPRSGGRRRDFGIEDDDNRKSPWQ